MHLLIYIWRNVRRNKLRSFLTILSVGFSLALMTILYGYLAMQSVSQAEAQKHDRLVVLNKAGFAGALPIAYVEKVKKMDGISAATPFMWYGGMYKEEQMPFAQFGVDPDQVFEVYSEYEIDPDQLEKFKSNKTGCLVDAGIAEQRNWEVGERIPLKGTIYQSNLDLELVGTFKGPQNTGSLWFNWYYLDDELEKTGGFRGSAGSIFAKCENSSDVATLSEEIDDSFANSENATRTRTEAAFQQMFADMLGDVQAYIRYISMAVVFALALVAATAMAMSMRERTTEIAVLKAIGFSKQRVLALVLGEATMIAIIGGLLGIVGGLGALHLLSQVPVAASMFPLPVWALAGPWLLGLIGVAAGIGFVSGVVPAILAAQLSVIDGLRQVV